MRYLLVILLAFTMLNPRAFAQESAQQDEKSFTLWLDEFKKDALAQGISQHTLDEALNDIAPLPEVIELDQKQPEVTLTLPEYLTRVVTSKRVEKGRELLDENRDLIKKISQEYGVQPGFIMALWGIESGFGDRMGDFGIVESLATLAYDGRRSDFFRSELIKALKIIDNGDVTAADMKGSWAGAMGQCQFMPSSFLEFAVDYDHDGKRDIWNSNADVFASIANYLHASGWHADEGWGMPVRLPKKFDTTLADIKHPRSLSEWKKLGIHRIGGNALPARSTQASLIMVGSGGDAKPYLVYDNYKVILKWNRSRYFATAVGMPADKIEK